MKRSWTTILLFSGLVGLLIILGAMQYRWQTQISENERERLHKFAQEDASRFAEDFNKQIQNAYFNFQIDAADWRTKNYRPFDERYEFWRSKAKYPDLITDFYFFDAAGKSEPMRFDRASSGFVPADWTPELRDTFEKASDKKNFQAVQAELFTLVLPQQEGPRKLRTVVISRPSDRPPRELESLGEPVTFGYLAMRLDTAVIKERMLPDLAAAYFGDGDFRVRVIDGQDQTIFNTSDIVSEPDVMQGLFELSPNDIFFFANRDLLDALGERKAGVSRENVLLSSHVESRTMMRTEVNRSSQGTVKVEVQRGGEPKADIFSAHVDDNGAHWTLAAQHTSGSIDAYIAKTKFRNLGIGFGILALLGVAVAAIIFSAERAKILAQRQIDFVSSVSHEFRTPLAVIYSAGENLADGVATDGVQVSQYGDLIKGEGKKLSGMVEQILEFAGARSRRRKYNFGEADIRGVVDGAITECRPLIEERKINLETSLTDSLPMMDVDSVALGQAIRNLIVNSIKYSNGKRWVRVATEKDDHNVKISVEDQGIGISKSDLRQIFEPFFRSKEVVDAQIHGNGLGLSLVKQIVEAHRGSVSAKSELGKGSKFTIELPIGG